MLHFFFFNISKTLEKKAVVYTAAANFTVKRAAHICVITVTRKCALTNMALCYTGLFGNLSLIRLYGVKLNRIPNGLYSPNTFCMYRYVLTIRFTCVFSRRVLIYP